MSDEEIVRLIQSGEQEAVHQGMERLVEAYGERIDATVQRVSPALDSHSREDLCQDVLLRIENNIRGSYRHEGKLWAYIETVIRGISIDTYRRKRKRDQVTPLGEDVGRQSTSLPEPAARSQDQPDERLIYKERVEAVRAALAEMKDECQEIISLYYMKGMKYREIAKTLGIPIGSVASRLARCLEFLGKSLPDEIVSME